MIEGEYAPKIWERRAVRLAAEPEKGRRCDVCYAIRLDASARKAAELGFPAFASVMSVSPWKKADVLNRIGRLAARKYGVRYLDTDFKKNSGFQKSVELSRRHGLYRQNYCGCRYSWRPKP
jgi:predicted adenine nucleotide alpha hydrolase (AANH) superfamily ATPase